MAACLICEGRNAYPHLLTELTASLNALPPHLTIAIGPEGGWTEAEIEQAIATGYRPVSLGARILRAVTAPLAALAVIGAVYEANGNTELMNPNFESS
jgi:16S rRNA (uracil1498-N3)-methyltransferase